MLSSILVVAKKKRACKTKPPVTTEVDLAAKMHFPNGCMRVLFFALQLANAQTRWLELWQAGPENLHEQVANL
jgi:hypothetical protein